MYSASVSLSNRPKTRLKAQETTLSIVEYHPEKKCAVVRKNRHIFDLVLQLLIRKGFMLWHAKIEAVVAIERGLFCLQTWPNGFHKDLFFDALEVEG